MIELRPDFIHLIVTVFAGLLPDEEISANFYQPIFIA